MIEDHTSKMTGNLSYKVQHVQIVFVKDTEIDRICLYNVN